MMLKKDGGISAQTQQGIAPHRFAALSNCLGQLPSEKLR